MGSSVIANTSIDTLVNSYVDQKKEEDPLGKDAFLTMLVAQMKHQDPLNPMDGTAYTAQLAQFTSLEQQFGMNDTLESILGSLNAKTENEDLLDYIGKQVAAENNTLTLTDGDVSGGMYVTSKAGDAMVSVYDEDNNLVWGYTEQNLMPGAYRVNWEERDRRGVPDGTYTFEVVTIGVNGNISSASTAISGKVSGVTYQNGEGYLVMNGKLIDPSTIIDVRMVEDEAVSDSDVQE